MAMNRPSAPVSSEQTPKATGLTQQQRTAVGVGALILCLLVGGGIVYWFLFPATPKRRTVTVDPQQQAPDMTGGGRIVRPVPRRQQFIVKQDDKTWIARGTSGGMRVRQDGSNYKFDLFYPGRDFLTPDQVSLVAGFVRAQRDEAMAREWGISADQITKLKAIELGGSAITVSNSERGEVRQLWDAYLKAAEGQPKNDAEKKLIARLDELGKNNLEASRKAFAQRLEQIKQVLTPQQIEKIAAR